MGNAEPSPPLPLGSTIQEESTFTGGIVVVKLDKMKEPFFIHKKLLRSRSPYFGKLLPVGSNPALKPIALSHIGRDTFTLFLTWLYTDRYTAPIDVEWISLCKLWILAERFMIPALQNQVVEAISCRLRQRDLEDLELELLHFVYDNTGPDSKLRMLFIHISMWYGNQDVFAQMVKEMPPVFQEDYASKQAEKAQKLIDGELSDPWDLAPFMVAEVVKNEAEGSTKIKPELVEDSDFEEKHSVPFEDTRTKRRRTR